MWYAKMYFSGEREFFENDAFGMQGVPSKQLELPFLESLLTFLELDEKEITPACPTARRSAPRPCRPGATGGCPRTRRPRSGWRSWSPCKPCMLRPFRARARRREKHLFLEY